MQALSFAYVHWPSFNPVHRTLARCHTCPCKFCGESQSSTYFACSRIGNKSQALDVATPSLEVSILESETRFSLGCQMHTWYSKIPQTKTKPKVRFFYKEFLRNFTDNSIINQSPHEFVILVSFIHHITFLKLSIWPWRNSLSQTIHPTRTRFSTLRAVDVICFLVFLR